MHRLVQGQHQEALPISSELLLPSLGWRLGRLVEIIFAERVQKLQVPLPQFEILLSNLGERWIRAGITDRFRALSEVLLPLRHGILISEEHPWDHAFNHCEMPEDPQRMAPAVRRRERRSGVAHLVDNAEH